MFASEMSPFCMEYNQTYDSSRYPCAFNTPSVGQPARNV
jgi:hypothetical protein